MSGMQGQINKIVAFCIQEYKLSLQKVLTSESLAIPLSILCSLYLVGLHCPVWSWQCETGETGSEQRESSCKDGGRRTHREGGGRQGGWGDDNIVINMEGSGIHSLT